MQVAQYTYQSPSTSAVQVGKLDPSSLKENNSNATNEASNATKQSQNQAQEFKATQTKEVVPSVGVNSIDLYV